MPPPLPPRAGKSEDPFSQRIAARGDQHDRQALPSHLPYRPPPPPTQHFQSRSPPRTHERLYEATHGIYERQPIPTVQGHDSRVPETSDYVRRAPEMPAHPRAAFRITNYSGPDSGFEHPRVTAHDETYGFLAEQGRVQDRRRPEMRRMATQDRHQILQSAEYATFERQRPYVPQAVTRSPFFQKGSFHGTPDAIGSSKRLRTLEPGQPIEQVPSLRLHLLGEDQIVPRLTRWHAEQQHQGPVPPQKPHNPQGFFQRQSRPPAFGAPQTRSRAEPNKLRSRMSLPPNSGRAAVPSFGDQDGALSRIQGVRGLTSRQSQSVGLAPSPTFATPR